MSPPTAVTGFTPKQGQYLAFIYAYTHVLGRPPAEADLQRHFGVSPPSVHQWCSLLNEQGLSDGSPGSRAASKFSCLPNSSPSYADHSGIKHLPPRMASFRSRRVPENGDQNRPARLPSYSRMAKVIIAFAAFLKSLRLLIAQ
jgi:hypothetical protein